MTVYVPILKAKHGEFEAWAGVAAGVASAATPLFELCPDPDVEKAVRTAAGKAIRYLPAGSRVAIDARMFPQTVRHAGLAGETVPGWVAQQLRGAGIEVMPVCPLLEVATHPMLGAVAAGGTNRAIIRVPARQVSAAQLGPGLQAAVRGIGLAPDRLHVLLDAGALRDVRDLAPLVAHVLTLAGALSGTAWASVTVAAGSFPLSVSHLPTGGTASAVPRFDAQLWREITSAGLTANFGDYGIDSPEMRSGGRGPLPNLRYTRAREWLVWRASRTRPGNESFYDLCKDVVADPAWAGPGYSWGDARVEDAAREVAKGPGGATQWRAYGTSHHITTVVDRLATLGEP